MKYSAIDLHSNNNVLVVTDETDRVCRKNPCPFEPVGAHSRFLFVGSR